MDVIGLSSRLKTSVLEKKSDDDFSDRLNYRFTVSLLIFGSIVITTRQYTSEVSVSYLRPTKNHFELISYFKIR